MWHLPSLLRIANLVQYQSLLLRKIVQMWYLLHICCNLATLVNPFFRPVLVKLRISSHKLRIETGRYDNIPRDERLYNLCNCNRIGDETHFLLDCPSFSSIRDMFFSKLEPSLPFLRLQSHESLLSHLMNSTDYFINIQLISFISPCFELRDKLISGIINPTDG